MNGLRVERATVHTLIMAGSIQRRQPKSQAPPLRQDSARWPRRWARETDLRGRSCLHVHLLSLGHRAAVLLPPRPDIVRVLLAGFQWRRHELANLAWPGRL